MRHEAVHNCAVQDHCTALRPVEWSRALSAASAAGRGMAGLRCAGLLRGQTKGRSGCGPAVDTEGGKR